MRLGSNSVMITLFCFVYTCEAMCYSTNFLFFPTLVANFVATTVFAASNWLDSLFVAPLQFIDNMCFDIRIVYT